MNVQESRQGRGALRAVALGGAVVGAFCAVALTTYAGARVGSPLVLRLLFAVWVFSPFAAILTGYAFSASWRGSIRVALHTVTLVTAAGWTMSRAPSFPMGSEPARVKASSRSAS